MHRETQIYSLISAKHGLPCLIVCCINKRSILGQKTLSTNLFPSLKAIYSLFLFSSRLPLGLKASGRWRWRSRHVRQWQRLAAALYRSHSGDYRVAGVEGGTQQVSPAAERLQNVARQAAAGCKCSLPLSCCLFYYNCFSVLLQLKTLQSAHERELASCNETVRILQQRLNEREEAFATQKRRKVPGDYYALKAKV